MKNIKIGCLLTILFLWSCKNGDELPIVQNPAAPNILLIIADDLGKDALRGYAEGSIKPNTPHLDALRNSGLSFNNFWSYPTCSPTRASILTGKYGYSTGVKWATDALSTNETTLQKYINDNTDNTYATAIVGKWHLSGNNRTFNPETMGIDYYAGLITGGVQDYFNWTFTEDGNTSTVTEYTTSKFTNLAIDWIDNQSKPWFMWLAYNAPHTPFHLPPDSMHTQGNLPPYTAGMNDMPYYMAAIEAMDFEIGRLLNSMPQEERDNSIIIFMGDNGTPMQVAQAPYDNSNAKGTLYQGGINVPFFVTGKGVSRTGTDDNLITSSDLFATLSEIAGISIEQIHNSQSFKALLSQTTTIRNYQYAEMDSGNNNSWTISNGVYKLIKNANGNEELYNLGNDPYEQNDLLNGALNTAQMNAKAALEAELANIRQ
ncbi:MAG: sulfatase-like hydrolase/transferase [Aureispira sp.]